MMQKLGAKIPGTPGPGAAARAGALPDWRSAGGLVVHCVSENPETETLLRETLELPVSRGASLEILAPAGAEAALEGLLRGKSEADGLFVLVADLGASTLSWCKRVLEKHRGDHLRVLALLPAEAWERCFKSGEDERLDPVLQPARREDLAGFLRGLGRLAAERAARLSGEREAHGLGQRLNELQTKLRLTKVLEEAVERLQRLSSTDGLTGITNRAKFEETLDLEWGQAVGDSFEIALILIDIDFFKRYNDRYGHILGDACLQKVARSLLVARESSRDMVARYGGEEFAVLLPGRTAAQAAEVAERLRQDVEALELENANSSVAPHITISAGVASAVPDLLSSALSLVQRADRALYRAKSEGRNRVNGDTPA